jgi:hypothetical protein
MELHSVGGKGEKTGQGMPARSRSGTGPMTMRDHFIARAAMQPDGQNREGNPMLLPAVPPSISSELVKKSVCQDFDPNHFSDLHSRFCSGNQ